MGDTLKKIGGYAFLPGIAEGPGSEYFLNKPEPPGTPDFTSAAREQAKLSKVNQNNPFASSGWTQGPDGRWTQDVSLKGGLGTAAQGLESQIGGLSQPMDWSQFGPVQTGDQARQQAIDAAYGQSTSRLDPQWDTRASARETALRNQGLSPGDAAYDSAMSQFGRERNDAYTSAMNSAIGQGTAAGDVAFRNNMTARQTAIANALRQRSQPLMELQSLQGFTGGMQQPSAAVGPNLLGAMQAQYEGDLQKYGIQNAKNNSTMGGASQLAPLGLAFL